MAFKTIYCQVLGTRVTHVTNLEGTVARIICPEYEASNGSCRRKRSGLGVGPLVQLLERVADGGTAGRGATCIFRVRP